MKMIPPTVTNQEHKISTRGSRPIIYDDQRLKDAKSKLIGELYHHRIMGPFTGPVRLTVKWCFPRGSHSDGEYKVTKPDTDNLIKALKDCMTLIGFWLDDAQVVSEINEKFWAEIPGIYIKIEEL